MTNEDNNEMKAKMWRMIWNENDDEWKWKWY